MVRFDGDAIRDRHPEIEVQRPPRPAAVPDEQRLPVAELHLHLPDEVGRDRRIQAQRAEEVAGREIVHGGVSILGILSIVVALGSGLVQLGFCALAIWFLANGRYSPSRSIVPWLWAAVGLATLVALWNYRVALAVFGFIVLFYFALPVLREYLGTSGAGGGSLPLRSTSAAEADRGDLGEDA